MLAVVLQAKYRPTDVILVKRYQLFLVTLTLSLPRCHLKTANKSVKFEIHKSFFFFFFFHLSQWHERISVKMHNIENRFVIRPENILFCRLVRARFSPEMLRAVAVKGLNTPSLNLPERSIKSQPAPWFTVMGCTTLCRV